MICISPNARNFFLRGCQKIFFFEKREKINQKKRVYELVSWPKEQYVATTGGSKWLHGPNGNVVCAPGSFAEERAQEMNLRATGRAHRQITLQRETETCKIIDNIQLKFFRSFFSPPRSSTKIRITLHHLSLLATTTRPIQQHSCVTITIQQQTHLINTSNKH